METKTKKPRSAPHVWKPFWKLRRGEGFYIGKTLFGRHGLFTAKAVGLGGKTIFVSLWRRVRTTELIKPAWPFAIGCVEPAPRVLDMPIAKGTFPYRAADYMEPREVYDEPRVVKTSFDCPRVESPDPKPITPSYGPSC